MCHKNMKKDDAGTLAQNTLDFVPTALPSAKHIVALVKKSGRITGYKLSDGSLVTKDEGVALAKHGDIAGVGIAHRRDTEYLKSIPDGTDDNNLGNLPTV